MNRRIHFSNMLLKLAVLVMTAMLAVSCSKSDDKDDKGGGGLIPDPNIPTLSEIKYELSPNAVIVPEATTKQLMNVDTLRHKLTLPASASMPEVGQCLIFNTPTKQLPYGLLAKVKSVMETNGGYEITYQEAELKDAFKDIEIPEQYIPLGQYVEHVYDADGKEVKFTKSVETRANGQEKFKITLPEVAWPVGLGLELTPKMTIDLALRYVMMYGDFKIDYAGVKVDADVTIGADLSFELTSKKYVNYRKSLLSIVCAGIPVGPVVITPGVEIAAVFKVDGKLSLEASISYKRTVRASVLYRQGSFTADASMDPEAEDALQYSFGPKYEGGVSYGLSVGPFLGIYGKTFALNIGLDVVKKESVSAKINLIELVKANLIPSTSIKSTDFLARLDGNKWNFAGWEGFTYNQAIGLQPTAILYVMGKGMGDLELSEISFPVDSRPIFPQVKIDEKDFLSANGEYVVLTMHMPTKSLFDDEVGFYALWTNTEDSKEEYKAPFDMDDDKVALLQKGKAVDVESRCRLNKGKNYRLKVYMQLMDNTEVLLYDGKFMVESDFSVSPSDLAYNWEGGSQNVKIDKGGYDYCGAYVPDADNSWAKWISVVVGNDGTVAIAVQPNLTFQERKGMVQCWVSTKNDPQSGESKTRNVYITQEPVTGVDWNPKELSFSGDGGSQDISFNFGGFKRFGGTVHEEGHGWCGVKAANGKLTITVQPNPSKENRQCVVDAYVTNSQNPTEEDKVIMPITVFQKGGDGQAAANNVKELWGKWTFTFNASGYNQVYTVTFGKDGSYYYENVDYNKPENNFTRVGTYKVLSYEQWTPTSEGVVGLADIEESFHNSLTGKDVVRQMTVKLHNNGYLGYQNYRFTKVE